MIEAIKNLATPAGLTEALRLNGHLNRGSVCEISVETFQSFFADFYCLEIIYSPDAEPALPARMILKVPFADMPVALDMGRAEVAAYKKLHKIMPDPPVARCFDAVIDEETGASHLLLEDLSPTLFRADADNSASLWQWERCVEALAELHAFWWESEALGVELGELVTEANVEEFEKLNEERLPVFLAALGDAATPEVRKTYRDTLVFLPGFWRQRLVGRARNTLIHGDAHSWNFLLPKEPENGRAFIIDLATLRVRPLTNDLAYLMALKWRPERRAEMEAQLLRHYHASLIARGVINYSREDCLLDYRHSILTHLFTPVVQAASGVITEDIWRANFERIIAAFDDLNCAELIA